MHNRFIAPLAAPVVFWTLLASATLATAQTLTWGVSGAGGSGNWDTTTADWFNGSQNVVWPSNGNAIFGGASGGTVSSFSPGPLVASMTFNTPGYVIQGGQIQRSTGDLTVTTNVDATISSTLSVNSLVKNGPGTLIDNAFDFDSLATVHVNQGELLVKAFPSLIQSNLILADAPGVIVTFGQSGSPVLKTLTGGGTSGGVVRPDNEARTLTLGTLGGGTFGGVLEDNGSGILAVNFNSGTSSQILTNVNTYSGSTTINGSLSLSGGGSALNSSSFSIQPQASLGLDNSGTVLADRVSDTSPIVSLFGSVVMKGNSTTPVEEKLGQLSFNGVCNITVQPSAAIAQMTFAGVQRTGHSVLRISGPGIQLTGLSNNAAGILPPFITDGRDWATVGADGRITALTTYSTDINSGSTNDNVKITAAATSLAAAATRGSLNLENSATSAQTLDLSGQTLSLTTGGILSSGNGPSTITNGAISTTAGEIVVTATNNFTIASSIAEGGVATALTTTGGTLTLSGNNTYAGPTTVLSGTLVVSSDANLGAGTTIDLSGTLMAAGSFSSNKGFMNGIGFGGIVNTAGFNLSFAGPNSRGLSKTGLGTLTLTNPVTGSNSLSVGTLALPNAASGSVSVNGGTLQAAGILSNASFNGPAILDIGGPGAAALTLNTTRISAPMTVDFGLGSGASDLWIISSGGLGPIPLNPGSLQFELRNLGGVTTGINYPLISYSSSALAQPPSAFAFAPDMAAAGWSGTFISTSNGVSVMFTSVPEPSVTALMFLPGVLLIWAARRRLQNAGIRQASGGARRPTASG
jgi:fibronectin-binding autotransporter adhesin